MSLQPEENLGAIIGFQFSLYEAYGAMGSARGTIFSAFVKPVKQ
jgi:hypothetical protein